MVDACMDVCMCVCVMSQNLQYTEVKYVDPKITASKKSCEWWAAHSHMKFSEQRVDVSCQIK